MFLNQSFDHNFGRFLPSLGDFYQVWAIFTNFGRFLPILGDFYQFWAIFTNFGRKHWRFSIRTNAIIPMTPFLYKQPFFD
jgi:hypothetical protein